MTFTTAAASEMRDRIGGVVGKAIAKELAISTFHSFCLQLCRSHAQMYTSSELDVLFLFVETLSSFGHEHQANS